MKTVKLTMCIDCDNAAKYGNLCGKCKARRYRQRNPLQATYNTLRYHARERGIEFNLSFEHWTEFCKKTNYLELRGKHPNDLTVDRKDCTKGYVDGNIQALTNKANVAKRWKEYPVTKDLTWAALSEIINNDLKRAA